MSRYIDADIPRKELCDWLHSNYISTEGGQWDNGTGEIIAECINTIDKAPTADVEPVIHAHWIDEGEDENDPNSGNHLYRCSNCYHSDLQAETTEVPYCWFCGARMDEEIKDV